MANDRPYIVKPGDYLRKIAQRYGFDADAIWSSSRNDKLRAKRKDPDQLVTGDVLFIPDGKPKWHRVSVGERNAFSSAMPTVMLKVAFVIDDGPLANEPCEIQGVAGGPTSTDGDGRVECPVPMYLAVVNIRFPKRNEVYSVRLGDLDPVDEPSGARQRLAALGYFGRAPRSQLVAGRLGAQSLGQTLRAFQRTQKLALTSELDEATCQRLTELYGS